MFILFILLLSFSEFLAHDRTRYQFLNDGSCMVRPTLIDMNLFKLKYYRFMIILDKCTGSCNVFSLKIYFPKKAKDLKVKAFNMITHKETKAKKKHISYDCKCKFNSITYSSNQNWNDRTYQCE